MTSGHSDNRYAAETDTRTRDARRPAFKFLFKLVVEPVE